MNTIINKENSKVFLLILLGVSPLVGLGNILLSTGMMFVVYAVCSLLCALWATRRTTVKVAVCRV
ncbi:hypothetical protein [Bacteroides acidifaciens]|uniref:hypothetical protein n=1 Tax=Bacteroides acidifaciens TaxID=85831 RepID=UPI0020CA4CE7|nr:hypothetical protein [Bacteroides acidifaciens]